MKGYTTVCFMQGFTINHAHKDIMFADGIFSVDLVRRKLKERFKEYKLMSDKQLMESLEFTDTVDSNDEEF